MLPLVERTWPGTAKPVIFNNMINFFAQFLSIVYFDIYILWKYIIWIEDVGVIIRILKNINIQIRPQSGVCFNYVIGQASIHGQADWTVEDTW